MVNLVVKPGSLFYLKAADLVADRTYSYDIGGGESGRNSWSVRGTIRWDASHSESVAGHVGAWFGGDLLGCEFQNVFSHDGAHIFDALISFCAGRIQSWAGLSRSSIPVQTAAARSHDTQASRRMTEPHENTEKLQPSDKQGPR